MKILLLGSGGREAAFAWKMAESSICKKIYIMPGNDGISGKKIKTIKGDPSNINFVLNIARELEPDLIVVGPEKPLTLGISDVLKKNGFRVFGPSGFAAQLEGSKIFAKNFMKKNDLPTANFFACQSYQEALDVLKKQDWSNGVVVKADGLAAGKGVVVAETVADAERAVFDFMKNPNCTVNADKVVIEERMRGKEVSAFAICDGENFLTLGFACDHKTLYEGNKGPNTGGMGGYIPFDWPTKECKNFIEEKIFKQVLLGMKKLGHDYTGILYAGLMIGDDGMPRLVEFNVRMGDPEAQILFPMVKGDLVPVLKAAADGKLNQLKDEKDDLLDLREGTAVHVVLTSKGYPSTDGGPLFLENEITYPENLDPNEGIIFFSGVKRQTDTETETETETDIKLVNNGGRVLGVTSFGNSISQAREKAYKIVSRINFNGAYWRKDIGS